MAWRMRLPFSGGKERRALASAGAEVKAGLPAGLSALGGGAVAAWSGRSYAALSREGFMRNPVAHRAVRMIAETAAATPFLLYDDARELDAHPFLDLIARPDGQHSGAEFFEAVYGHLILAGNAFIEAIPAGGGLAGLQLLRPDRVRVVEGPDGWAVAHDYQAGAARRRFAIDPVAGRGLLHLRLFHPLDDHAGFAPLAAAQMALDLHNQATTWNKALLDNSARPSGALVYQPKDGGNLSDDQYRRLKEELEEGYQGARRAGRPMLLEGGLDWKTLALSPRDMDFIEARHAAARDIALAFGVPPMLLGIPGDNTYSNLAEANRAFWRQTIVPLVRRVADDLSNWLSPAFGGTTLAPDFDDVEALAEDRAALWARVGAAEFLSDAEKREMVGIEAEGR